MISTNPTEINLDATDRKILLYVTKGYGSSYSIWSAMKKDAIEGKLDRKVMTYRNTNKRVIKLIKLGLIEETRPSPDAVNLHGRKDYKITDKGIGIIVDCLETYLKSTNEFMESINQITHSNTSDLSRYTIVVRNPAQIKHLLSSISELVNRLHNDEAALVVQSKQRVKPARVNPISSIPGKVLSNIQVEQPAAEAEKIDTILNIHYETLKHRLKTTNIMSTIQDGGNKIRLSTMHPHTPKDIARLTEQNIEKMKKTLPRTPKIVEYLERLIESIDQIEAKRPTTKTIRPFIISTKS